MTDKLDLHLHSVHSDGSMTPEELSAEAFRVGAELIALTDHANISGLGEMLSAAKSRGIATITGVELECMLTPHCEAHILAYAFDPGATPLIRHIETISEQRARRNERILARLKSLGADIARLLPTTDLKRLARTHMAFALANGGYAADMGDAFRVWLGRSGRAFYSHERPQASELLDIIRRAGGISVLAHPFKLRMDVPEAIKTLAPMGLGGVEAYYPSHTPGLTALLKRLAQAYGMHISCGSDFHGAYRPGVEIGCCYLEDEILRFWHELREIVL